MKRSMLQHIAWALLVAVLLVGFALIHLVDRMENDRLNAEITGLRTQLAQAPIPNRDGDTWAVVSNHTDAEGVRTINFMLVSYNFSQRDAWYAKLAESNLSLVQNCDGLSEQAGKERLTEVVDGTMDLYRDAPGAWQKLPPTIDKVVIYNSGNAFFQIDRNGRNVTDLR